MRESQSQGSSGRHSVRFRRQTAAPALYLYRAAADWGTPPIGAGSNQIRQPTNGPRVWPDRIVGRSSVADVFIGAPATGATLVSGSYRAQQHNGQVGAHRAAARALKPIGAEQECQPWPEFVHLGARAHWCPLAPIGGGAQSARAIDRHRTIGMVGQKEQEVYWIINGASRPRDAPASQIEAALFFFVHLLAHKTCGAPAPGPQERNCSCAPPPPNWAAGWGAGALGAP